MSGEDADALRKDNQVPPLSLLTGIFILLAFVLGLIGLSNQDMSFDLILACYIVLIVLLVANFRNTFGYAFLMKGKRPALMFYFLPLVFVFSPAFTKYKFNGMASINGWVIGCSIVFTILFCIAVLYRNKNFTQQGTVDPLDAAQISITGLLIAYGFCILFNCSEIADSRETYAMAINYKYIETGRDKSGIYHMPHFVVQSWPGSIAFGNDIKVPSKWFYRYTNIDYVKGGDSIYVNIHSGALNLKWMEPIKFIDIPNIVRSPDPN